MNQNNDILATLQFRHACKEFDPDRKVSPPDFGIIMESARISPSSFGIEPWKFLVIQNPSRRGALREVTWGGQKQIPTCSHLVVILCRRSGFMRFDKPYVRDFMERIQKSPQDVVQPRLERYKKFQQVDFALLESDRALFDWSLRQTYIALANMMTAAASLGVDSCPIEGFDRGDMERVLHEQCAVNPDEFGVSCLVSFGFRVHAPRQLTRQAMEDIVEWL